MKRETIIEIAEDVGLLVKDEDYPYSMPAHQRLISRLGNFATRIEREILENLEEKGE